MLRAVAAVVLLFLALGASPALAEDAAPTDPAPAAPTPTEATETPPATSTTFVPAVRSGSFLATGVAIVPGVFVPGLGHFALGEPEAGKRFLVVDAVGLGLLGLGFGGLIGSWGSDKVASLCLFPVVAGFSVLTVAVLADLIGSAHGTAPWPMPWTPTGALALRLGYSGLFASKLDFHHGVGLEAAWTHGALTVTPSGVLDPSLSFYALGLAGDLVLWQPAADPVTRLSLGVAVHHQRYRFDRFAVTVAELHAELRLNLRHLTPTMQNAYVLARIGGGLEAFSYDAVPFSGSDLMPLLVLEVGLGLQATERVNVELVYRNRKDQPPGGVIFPGIFDSYLGFFEARGRVAIAERWAVLAGLRWGNGLLPWISVEAQLF